MRELPAPRRASAAVGHRRDMEVDTVVDPVRRTDHSIVLGSSACGSRRVVLIALAFTWSWAVAVRAYYAGVDMEGMPQPEDL